MKKLLVLLLIVSLAVMTFAACNAQIDITVNGDSTSSVSESKPSPDSSSTKDSSSAVISEETPDSDGADTPSTPDSSSASTPTTNAPVEDDPDEGWGPMIPLG